MNISSLLTKDYENKPHLRTPPKQTQSNPIFTLPILTTCAFGAKTCAFDAKNSEKLARLVRKSAPKTPSHLQKKSSRKTHFQSLRKLATAKKAAKYT